MKSKLLAAFSRGFKPDERLEIVRWSRDNVQLLNSKKADYVDLTQSPWLRQPLQDIIDNKYDHFNCVMSTGSGKSTLATTLLTYLILEQPSQVAYFLPTAPLAQTFMEGTLLPSLKKNQRALALFPTKAHHVKKDVILFPHMTFHCRGMSIANTQSISVDKVLVDEAWIAPDGSLQYAVRRLHDRPFAASIFVSQAGNTNTEFHEWCQDAQQYEYHYQCPHCQQYHPWRFKNLNWDKDFKHVYYKCSCGAELDDTPQVRRTISSNGRYVEVPTEGTNPKRITYTFNIGLSWSVSWETLAREFVKANNAAKKFDFEPLKLFKTQRLSEFWHEDEIQFVPVEKSGYSLKDKEKFDITLLSCDVQGEVGDTLLWFQVRTFKKDTGESRLLDFGRMASYDDIPRKQAEWGLPANCVAIDVAYKTDEVREFAAHYGYLTLNGVNAAAFPVNIKGKPINRIYGLIRKERTLQGKFASYAPYSSTRCKVVCAGLRSSKTWAIPHDIPDIYVKQLGAEIYQDGKWIQRRRDNHSLDMDSMNLVQALIHGVNIPMDVEQPVEE